MKKRKQHVISNHLGIVCWTPHFEQRFPQFLFWLQRGGGRRNGIDLLGGRGRVSYLRKLLLMEHLDVLCQMTQDKSLQGLALCVMISKQFLFILFPSPGVVPFKEGVECLDEDVLVLLGMFGGLALQLMMLEEGVVCILLKPFDEFLLGYFLQFFIIPRSLPLAVSSFSTRASAFLHTTDKNEKFPPRTCIFTR